MNSLFVHLHEKSFRLHMSLGRTYFVELYRVRMTDSDLEKSLDRSDGVLRLKPAAENVWKLVSIMVGSVYVGMVKTMVVEMILHVHKFE